MTYKSASRATFVISRCSSWVSTRPVGLLGELTINTLKKRVTVGSEEIKLTSREYSLLEYLAFRTGEVVSRQEIWDHVYEYYEDASSNAVDVYIGYLRKKLICDPNYSYIHTRRGQGYLLEYLRK